MSPEQREGTWRFWNGKCAYCGMHATSLDHYYPASRGGPTDVYNLVPACRPCQNAKADSPPEVFLRERGIDAAAFEGKMRERVRLAEWP